MPEYDLLIVALIGIVTIGTAVLAVMQRNLIRAVLAYALTSMGVSAIFFVLASPYAGALELTVGAGLVAVLFLVALILSGGEEAEEIP